ncbi:MAG: NAD(P)H-dependent glycerol-3-phosphate dehydrogenase [Alphaproteobacteria bacterium]
MSTVSVIGAGSWGTAIALAAHRAGSKTTIWSHSDEEIARMIETGGHPNRLPGVKIDPEITLTDDLETACQSNIIVIAVPAQVVRQVTAKMACFVPSTSYIIIASKGIEIDTGLLMSEVTDQTLPGRSVAVLTGPSFALPVALGKPTGVMLAAETLSASQILARAFNSKTFRVYASDDVIGAQIGGALKNVLAIASGIIRGKELGENALAFLITRGLSEITRLAVAKGGRADTIAGLSGLGDICLSCTSSTSRNFAFGELIGQGMTAEQAAEKLGHLVEGAASSKTIEMLSESLKIEMPICGAVDAVLSGQATVEEMIEALLSRPTRVENIGDQACHTG